MNEQITTVLIIGAGPAGSAAAHRLNLHGIDNIIIDKSDFPRAKLCAGVLSARTLDIFDYDISHLIVASADRAILHFNSRRLQWEAGQPYVHVIDRYQFDRYLLDRAIDSGSRFIRVDNWRIEGDRFVSGDNSIRFSYIVGADGAYSRVRKLLGLSASHGLGIERLSPSEITDRRSLHFYFNLIRNGYGWVFPASSQQNSVGVARLDNTKTRIKEDYKAFADSFGLDTHGDSCVIPIYDQNNIYGKGNILLTGDAAQLADHVMGEGIYYAVSSGQIAADSIREANLLNRQAAPVYHQNIEPLLDDLRGSAAIAAAIYQHPRSCYFIGKLFPGLIDNYLCSLRDNRYAYGDMRSLLKKKLPWLHRIYKFVKRN